MKRHDHSFSEMELLFCHSKDELDEMRRDLRGVSGRKEIRAVSFQGEKKRRGEMMEGRQKWEGGGGGLKKALFEF